MDGSIIVAVAAMAISAISFFYKIGQDSHGGKSDRSDKIDQVLESTKTINKKLDDIAKWQREAAAIHSAHDEKINTLFRRMEVVERRLEDREVMNDALRKILEKVSHD